VPVAVLGTRHIMPKGAWRVRSGRIIVRFGEAVRVSNYSEATRDALMADVRARIDRMLEAPARGTMRKRAS
jgi:1-acyl-sn-glycerol-3-phosphate acyltransferase